MKDDNKTKKQLVHELTELRSQDAGLEKTRKELAVIKIAADEVSEYAESIINTVREPLIALDQDLRVVKVSRSFYDFFKVNPEETMGQLIYDLGNKQWDIPKLRELLETILPEKATFDNYEVEHDFATIGRRTMLLNARQIKRVFGKERIILLAIEDITEHKRLEDLLIESEKRFRHLFETASDGIVLLEKSEGKITHANPATEKMLGYTHKDSIGNSLQDIGVSLDLDDFQTTMQNLNKSDILYYDDVPVITKFGQHIDTDIYLVDRATLVQCNIRDITNSKRAEEELKNTYEQVRSLASRLQEVREETRTSLSHDIHDELGGALAKLKMDLLRLESIASGEEDGKKRQAMLDIIHGAKELINNTILSTRRIIMEQRPSVLDDFGLVAAMEWQLGEYKTHTDISFKFNVGQIEIDIDKNLATVVFRIFQEALANVIRHSKATEVYISLRVDEGQLIMEIKDNGRGITENEITGTGSFGILGIRERALAHGGEINIAGESGKGTTLNLKIPIQ